MPFHDDFSAQLDAIVTGLNLRPTVSNRWLEMTEGFVGRDLWNDTVDHFRMLGQSDIPTQEMGDQLACDLSKSPNLEANDTKPFIAKLHVLSEQFACDHPVLQSLLKTYGRLYAHRPGQPWRNDVAY